MTNGELLQNHGMALNQNAVLGAAGSQKSQDSPAQSHADTRKRPNGLSRRRAIGQPAGMNATLPLLCLKQGMSSQKEEHQQM